MMGTEMNGPRLEVTTGARTHAIRVTFLGGSEGVTERSDSGSVGGEKKDREKVRESRVTLERYPATLGGFCLFFRSLFSWLGSSLVWRWWA